MNRKENQQLGYMPAEKLDAAILERYKVSAKTEYNIFNGRYVTKIDANCKDEALLRQVHAFIFGWAAGNEELSARLSNPNLFL